MLEKVRSAITAQLVQFGAADTENLRETILIRQGLYCGRKFECDGFHVVWFVEENQIKFYGAGGALLLNTTAQRCLEHFAEPSSDERTAEPIRRAA
ncbi:MAG: hypothetical protein U0892_18045 [Pirellulales bacterium]